MVLRFGDRGEAVKSLQRGLNKLGEMLLIDGHFGRGTRDAIVSIRDLLGLRGPAEADDELQQAVAAVPDPLPPVTAAGVTFIAREEVSDAPTYRRKHQTPTLPPASSGITIGIGYDCRFVTKEELEADWSGHLPATTIEQLVPATGKIGTPALLAQVSGVVVPLAAAMNVFVKRTLPKHMERTRSIYPQVAGAELNAAQRTTLVSLVYNRGTSLTGDRRREMQAIQDLLESNRIDEVADQFESMTRLWNEAEAPGLIRRRRAEATLWRSGFGALQLD
jgi:hypothetical protein